MKYKFNAELIRQNLNSKGKTQAELAQFLNVYKNKIGNILKSGKIEIDMLEKIAEFLEVSIAEFFVNEDGDSLQSKLNQLELCEKKIEILKDALIKAEYIIELQKRLIPQL